MKDRRPHAYDSVREQVLSSSIDFVPPDIKQSEIDAEARLKFPINLGDCFAYALAKQLKRPILTLDQEFRKTDVGGVVAQK